MAEMYGDPNLKKKPPTQPQAMGAGDLFSGAQDTGGAGPYGGITAGTGGDVRDIGAPPKAATAPQASSGGAGPYGGITAGMGTPTAGTAPQKTAPPPAAPPPPTNDPFAAIGGGVQLPTGEWVPKGHPLAASAAAAPSAPQATTVRQPAQTLTPAPAQNSADPFASIGGGVQLPTGEWVPKGTAADPWKGVGAAQVAAAGPATPAPGGVVTPPPVTVPPTQTGGGSGPLIPPSAPPGTPSAPDQKAQVGTAFRDSLLKMLSDNQKDPSLADPALKGQMDAYSLAQTRARDRARSAMAERAAQQGGAGVDSGAFNNDLAGLFQAQGEAEGQFGAGLVGQELQNRRNQLMQAATLAGNQMSQEDSRALQRELADLDAKIRREGMAQQGGQFDRSLAEQARQSGVDAELKRLGITTQADLGGRDVALRGELGRGQLNLGLLSALLQNQQFGQRLGADVGMFNSRSNSDALLQMLGML